MWSLLAQMTQVTSEEVKEGYSGLIFTGLFFLALIIAGIWWLKRQT
jgi:hypothetical protein